MRNLDEENRVLRERVDQLERSAASKSDSLRQALLEHATPFLSVVNPQGRFLASGRASESFGAVVGRSVLEFAPPEEHQVILAALSRVVVTGKPLSYETQGHGEDGTPGHCYLVSAAPVFEGQNVVAIVLAPVDITERVRLERSLAERTHSLQLAVEATRLGMWRWDLRTNAVDWDDRVLEIVGARQPPTFEDFLELVHPDDRERLKTIFSEVLATGVYPTFEHRLAAHDGSPEKWLLASGTVVKDADGKAAVLMGGLLDITEQKRLSGQLQRAERVEAVGQLAAGIAHNINNLLAAILPNVEYALGLVSGEAREALTAALDASMQARGVVQSLLSLARKTPSDSGQPAEVSAVLASVEKLCRMTLPREIELEFSAIAPGHAAMSASDLEQTVLNLVLNARDAVESSKVRRISVVAKRPTPHAITLQVTDTGAGMTEEVRRRAFEPFFTTKSPHRGTGLGLANVVARVREAGGQLDCQSEVGVGSTFTLVLPSAPRPVQQERSPAPEPQAPAGHTILIVDDEPMVRRSLRRLLEHDGFTVMEAPSASDARLTLDTHGAAIDVIILDHSMPDETGVEALPSLRARSRAKIVLFSGLTPEEPGAVDAVLSKPARSDEITRVLREVFAKPGARVD